jgi:CheY-like chemotaxis protein
MESMYNKLPDNRLLKKLLFEISDLNLDRVLERMNDSQLESYWDELDSFTENFPEQEEKVKKTLAAKDYYSFSEQLTYMRNSLKKIYADDLVKACQSQITTLAITDHDKLEAQTTNLLAKVSMLSIDVQMLAIKLNKNDDGTLSGKTADKEGVKSILAVDDQAIFLSTLTSFLKGTQYKLTCTASCKTALDYLQKNSPDLFILDIMMPEMDGFELAQKIKDIGQTAPIIFLTGNATKEYVLKAVIAGGKDFIVKPVSKEQVIAKISRFI